jgi:hypothetical protein
MKRKRIYFRLYEDLPDVLLCIEARSRRAAADRVAPFMAKVFDQYLRLILDDTLKDFEPDIQDEVKEKVFGTEGGQP